MRRERRNGNDGVGLAKADHVVECWRQRIEESLECFARNRGHVNREERRGQAQEHELLAKRRIGPARPRAAMNLNLRM